MLKKRKIGRRGQATVEYLMFIVVITSIVAGLASYSSTIESKFEAAKVGLRDKLAGDYQIQRSDFFSKKISTGGAEGGEGTGGGGAAGTGGKKPVVQGGQGDTKDLGTGRGKEGAGEQVEQETPKKDRQEVIQQERQSVAESERATKEYQTEQQTAEDAARAEEKEAISERQLAMASEAERAELLRKAHDRGLYTDKERAFERQKWNIGKLLIIIIVVVVFLIIILKSRQGRD